MKTRQIKLSEPVPIAIGIIEFRNAWNSANSLIPKIPVQTVKSTTNDNKSLVILGAAKNSLTEDNLPGTCTDPVLSATASKPTTNNIQLHFSSPLERGVRRQLCESGVCPTTDLSVCTRRETTTNCNKFDAEPATAKDSGQSDKSA